MTNSLTEKLPSSSVLAYTCSYHDRPWLYRTVQKMRAQAGCWFDWNVYLGNPSDHLRSIGTRLLEEPAGIQQLGIWPENRGQHWATRAALDCARREGYRWLLRIDDDVTPKTERWLAQLLERTIALREKAGDDKDRIVAAPRIIGLRNPPRPLASLNLGQPFVAEGMPILGGAVRLHPVSFFEGWEPNIYNPLGRKDPEEIVRWTTNNSGLMVRYPDIRVTHRTEELEKQDTKESAHARRMGYYWPYLGEGT